MAGVEVFEEFATVVAVESVGTEDVAVAGFDEARLLRYRIFRLRYLERRCPIESPSVGLIYRGARCGLGD